MILIRGSFRRYRRDIISIAVIVSAFIALITVIMLLKSDGVWGSQTDWQNQHFAIPEYFRTRFYETGDLFPDFAPQLGAGQNIYNLSYYGLMNPVYMIAYLLPEITMADYIQAAGLISVLVSCVLVYFLMKRHFEGMLPLFPAILFMLSAPLIFHSHRHIMFIAYMPFELTAMLAAGGEDSWFNRGVLIISAYSILCTSFYFSISAFAAIIIYIVFAELERFGRMKISRLIQRIAVRLWCMFLGGLTAGALWLPTFFTLISGREGGSSFVNVMKLLIPTINLDYIMYGPYSAGMTSIAVISAAALLISGNRAEKFLARVFAVLICCPLIIYLCNGTMYIDSKILIPFIPLLAIICGGFTVRLISGSIGILPLCAAMSVITAVDVFFGERKLWHNLIVIADTAVILSAAAYLVRTRKKTLFFASAAVIALINCMTVNFNEKFASKETVSELYSDDVRELADEAAASDFSFYRFAGSTSDSGESVNMIYGEEYYSTNIYSSVSSPDYRNFRYNLSSSENIRCNNACQCQPKNIVFNVLMGCRYRIDSDPEAMSGETVESVCGDKYLFRSENSLPVGYACANTMTEQQWKKLGNAERSEAMLENIIIPVEQAEKTLIPSRTSDFDIGYTVSGDTSKIRMVNGAYEVSSDIPFSVCAELDRPVSGKLLFIRFRADNRVGKESERSSVWVSINGVRNTLSAPTWKYHNKNYDFSYVISSAETIKRLEFGFSAGNYILSEFEITMLDESALAFAPANKDNFIIDRDTMGGDTIEGTIDVSEDGWFNLSVPYDKGFEILVDGERTDYYKTNTAFIGFPIESGGHSIIINYHAPLRIPGLLMTITGGMASAMMLAYMYYCERKRTCAAVPAGA